MKKFTAFLKAAVAEATKFVTKNTPEFALGSALLLDFQQEQAGTLNPTQAALAAILAIMAFGAAETSKDKGETAATATVAAAALETGATPETTAATLVAATPVQ
jgi:alkylhydroperoxidase/carboxymuconolactone decarboxylase family protein YurZ